MKVNYLAPLLCIGVLALTGCNDPKKPSESNFKEAAQQYLDTVYPACYIKANFPYKTDGFNINNMPEILHAMAEKGLLTETAFCLIQRPYISKTLLTRRISPRGSP
ncbi:hypothetical protein R8558_26880 (plasmid) [Klebsiella pneumoniae]|uniref:hypothetical protein n=1 Tax=Klebsiella pneumoniae TaxID=573 RepID=UPI0029C9BED8|nr:hypothetical protein [Klebsiella pneumoniae]WPI78481.1 hypothetical protein R8558_26880 [Klebsiella pneumoniae]